MVNWLLSDLFGTALLVVAVGGLVFYVWLEYRADLDERRAARETQTDDLTGLLTDAAWLAVTERRRREIEGVHVIALAGLSAINRDHGPDAVKQVMKAIARRLSTAYAGIGPVEILDASRGRFAAAIVRDEGHRVIPRRVEALLATGVSIAGGGEVVRVMPRVVACHRSRLGVVRMRGAALADCEPDPRAADTAIFERIAA